MKLSRLGVFLVFFGGFIGVNGEENVGNTAKQDDAAISILPRQQLSNAGYFTLRYNVPNDDISRSENWLLQVSKSNAFAQVLNDYPIGETKQISLSGYPNGHYYFRLINTNENQASDPALVVVKHHSQSLAFALFATGISLFTFLVGLIAFYSHKSTQNN
jgi:hypothetical protein